LVAGFLSVGVAHARAADPYVVYTANKFVNGAALLRIDPVTGAVVEISRNGAQGNLLRHPYDVAVERDGSLLVADMGQQNQKDGAVIRIAPFTGRQQLVSNGPDFYDPAGITLAPDGTIYVADSFPGTGSGIVVRVDPKTGAERIVSSDWTPLSLFDLSFGIAMDRDGSLVVVNRSLGGDLPVGCGLAGSVMRVDPATGYQTPLAGVLSFPNVFLSYPVGVAIEPGGGVIVANERTDDVGQFQTRIFMPVTGEGANSVTVYDETGNIATGSFYTEFGFDTIQRSLDQINSSLGIEAPPPVGTPAASPVASPGPGLTPTPDISGASAPEKGGAVGSTLGGLRLAAGLALCGLICGGTLAIRRRAWR